SFIGSYHGCIAGSMSNSGHTAMTHTLPRPGLVLLPYPTRYRPRFSPDEVLAMLDYQFETTCPPEQVAAVLIEPILSDGGLIVPPDGFLKALEERCRAHGILVVLDEVKVGLARSGKLHAFEHHGLEPDITVFGKGLGGGLPLSAMVGPADILDHAPAFVMQTTAGNPVCTAVGGAVLDTILAEDLASRAVKMGATLRAGFAKLAERHEMIGDVRGLGLAIGVDLVASRETQAPVDATMTAKVIYRAYELGPNFLYVGLDANVLEITLTVSEAEIAESLDIIARALADAAAGAVPYEAVQAFMN
ncbi:MAG: aspartate aminotransferase family protein, partial [Rhodospirillaceae bacterium]|nr:aspartate aminotransferase family protein [Rhodospirillaceae bacterium]